MTTPATESIFSGLKAVDLSSFVPAPGDAVIRSDLGADVIKVEPPSRDNRRTSRDGERAGYKAGARAA